MFTSVETDCLTTWGDSITHLSVGAQGVLHCIANTSSDGGGVEWLTVRSRLCEASCGTEWEVSRIFMDRDLGRRGVHIHLVSVSPLPYYDWEDLLSFETRATRVLERSPRVRSLFREDSSSTSLIFEIPGESSLVRTTVELFETLTSVCDYKYPYLGSSLRSQKLSKRPLGH